MIRLILIVIFLIIFFILSIPAFFIEWLIGKCNRRARDISSLRIVQGAFKIILFLAGTKVTVIGEEHVPKDAPVLYVGNHRGFFDILITYSRCPDLTGFVSKKEIEKVPLLSTWMKYLYCLFLDRNDIKEGLKTIMQGIEYVKRGISIFIFPGGTRSHSNTMLPFKEGSLKIAEKSGCPIIPVAMVHTSEIFEDQFPFIKKTHVVLEYGAPIYPKELDKEDRKFLGAYTQKIIQEMVTKNAQL